MLHRPLYRRENSGRVRLWQIEQQGASYRVICGLKDGVRTPSGWLHCVSKHGGEDLAQASSKIRSAYQYHLAREYHETDATAHEPKFFRPMLAGTYAKFCPGFVQPKLDGIRCIARAEGLFSREGRPILGVPHVADSLRALFEKDPHAVIDGELYSHQLNDDFNTISSLARRRTLDADQIVAAAMLSYHVYDFPSHAGKFSDRSQALSKVAGGSPFIVAVETRAVAAVSAYDDLHQLWVDSGYEGSMWRADAPYEQKRSRLRTH